MLLTDASVRSGPCVIAHGLPYLPMICFGRSETVQQYSNRNWVENEDILA
jgi:hypothetical protein